MAEWNIDAEVQHLIAHQVEPVIASEAEARAVIAELNANGRAELKAVRAAVRFLEALKQPEAPRVLSAAAAAAWTPGEGGEHGAE